MFTGIVQGLGEVKSIDDRSGLRTMIVAVGAGSSRPVQTGASVSISGICLTVTKIDGNEITFDIMGESLNKTTLGSLMIGDQMNVERSATIGDEIGGHLMSGHVYSTVEIIKVDQPENNYVLTFKVAPELIKYILPKGFIGLDGCSLSVVDVDKIKNTFTVWLIPETLRVTTFQQKKVGDQVNLEIDSRTQAIVDTVENYLKK